MSRHMNRFDLTGYTILPAVVGAEVVASLIEALASIGGDAAVRARDDRVYAVRNLMSLSPAVRQLAVSPQLRAVVEPLAGRGACVVRAILFDKSADANWKVAWHQDLSIAVKARIDVPGFGPWSVKSGVVHVQPPVELLQRMLTLRLHLDDCTDQNGPLRVKPESHQHGVLSSGALDAWRDMPERLCLVPAGGVVLMRPLLLHASSSAAAIGHRRVIHLEWSADHLPGGLRWAEE